MRKEWNNSELEFLKDNIQKLSYAEMAEQLNRTRSSVQLKCSKMGIKKGSKYFYNKDYFETIDSEEKAYWLGFIAGDGYTVRSKVNAELGIELNEMDCEHLKRFNKCLEGNVEVGFRQRFDERTQNTYKMCFIRFYSIKLVDDLIKLGIIPNKSLFVCFPNIQQQYYIPFLRGYFDSNGCICFNKKRNCLSCDYSSGSIEMINSIRKILFEYGISSYISYEKTKTIRLNIKGMKNSFDFCNLIYKNSNIHLSRKYNKFCLLSKKYNIEQRINK